MENTSIRLGLTDFLKALLIPSSDHRLSATRGHTLDSTRRRRSMWDAVNSDVDLTTHWVRRNANVDCLPHRPHTIHLFYKQKGDRGHGQDIEPLTASFNDRWIVMLMHLVCGRGCQRKLLPCIINCNWLMDLTTNPRGWLLF